VVELASDDVVCSGAAVVGLGANNLRISEGSLLISAACASGGSLQLLAWVSDAGGEAGASRKGVLSRLGAGQAAFLAPAEEAVGLAVLGTVLASHCVALGACRSNSN